MLYRTIDGRVREATVVTAVLYASSDHTERHLHSTFNDHDRSDVSSQGALPVAFPLSGSHRILQAYVMADEESKPSSLARAIPDSDIYITEHLSPHISATRRHLTGAPEHPEPPYAQSFHPPTGHWTPAEKALFFRALSVHSRLRPDLIAASIATKSTLDVAVYLSLLRDGATRANAGTITRDLHPAAYEVSPALVALEEKHAAQLCAAEPAREREAREEEVRLTRNGMRARRGQGLKGSERDREGQKARLEAFEKWRGEREVEWAREDALGRLDGVMLQVLDRMLRVDGESRGEADAGSAKEVAREGEPSIMHHPPVPSSSRRATTPPQSSLLPPNPDYSDAIPSNLSPTSRRLISKRLYMRRKRAEASGSIAQLDPSRLKPGRKASDTSKYKPRRRKDGDDDDDDDELGNPERPVRGETRPYRIQRELERLGIGTNYLRENGMDLFHLSALGRLMQYVLSLFRGESSAADVELFIRRGLDCTPAWTRRDLKASQSPSQPRPFRCYRRSSRSSRAASYGARSRCASSTLRFARIRRCGVSASAPCVRFMCAARWSFVVAPAAARS